MKLLFFHSGVGNQLFHYCFYKYLEEKYGKCIYGAFMGNEHNGYELEKYFDVRVKMPCFSLFLLKIVERLRNRFRLLSYLYVFEAEGNSILKWGLFYKGDWQDKKYLNAGRSIRFKNFALSSANDAIKTKILSCNSVAIHIRRSDYISAECYNRYWHLEDTDYYQKAIEYVKSRFENYSIFVFSDDIEWCKENMSLTDTFFIDWNKGNDSIYDMYLMSLAKVNIIANSTFSFWAAYLNRRSELTIYPSRWYQKGSGLRNPDIFPDEWIGL